MNKIEPNLTISKQFPDPRTTFSERTVCFLKKEERKLILFLMTITFVWQSFSTALGQQCTSPDQFVLNCGELKSFMMSAAHISPPNIATPLLDRKLITIAEVTS